MAKKAKGYKIQYKSEDPSNPKFKDSGKASLQKDDWIEIELNDDFPDGSTIDSVTFYNNQVVDGQDQKDDASVVGAWSSEAGDGPGLGGIFSCSSDSSTEVTVTDEEDLSAGSEVKYWFATAGTIGGTDPAETWSVDPELINKSN